MLDTHVPETIDPGSSHNFVTQEDSSSSEKPSTLDVPTILRDPNDDTIQSVLLDIKSAFLKGVGRYNADGTFDAHAKLFGDEIVPASPSHRRLRTSLRETIYYNQGYAFIVESLHAKGKVTRHENSDFLFEEIHLNRTLLLLDDYFKSDGKTLGTTLTQMNNWGRSNNSRNRSRLRDSIAPVFEYYGLWTVRRDDGGYAMFTAGPLLVMFVHQVLDNMPDHH